MRKRADSNYFDLIRGIFQPSVDHHRPRSIAEALRRGLVPPQFMREALEIAAELDRRPRKPKCALPARSLYNDHSWDNAVRVIEDAISGMD